MVVEKFRLETWGNEEVAKSAVVLHQSRAQLSPVQASVHCRPKHEWSNGI